VRDPFPDTLYVTVNYMFCYGWHCVGSRDPKLFGHREYCKRAYLVFLGEFTDLGL
jgi:hypothetical protein